MLRDMMEATVRSLAQLESIAGGSGAWYKDRLATCSETPRPGVLVVEM